MKQQSTGVRNLVLESEYRVYYARVRIAGRIYLRSLQEKDFTQAQLKLPGKLDEIRDSVAKAYISRRLVSKVTFGEAVSVYAADFETDPRLSARTKVVRRNSIAAVRRTWPEVFDRQLQQISHEDLKRFLRAFENGKGRWTPPGAKKSIPGTGPTTINGIIKLFTEVFRLGLAEAAPFGRNPADDLPRKGYTKRLLQLPSRTQFYALVEAIRSTGCWNSAKAADLVEGLAYSGMRLGEAQTLTWRCVGFERGMINIHGTKTPGSMRQVPMTSPFKELLIAIRGREKVTKSDRVFAAKEATVSLKRGCQQVGVQKLTHHDLRHLFATTCIESRIDIPTVAGWLGHVDGGVVAMTPTGTYVQSTA